MSTTPSPHAEPLNKALDSSDFKDYNVSDYPYDSWNDLERDSENALEHDSGNHLEQNSERDSELTDIKNYYTSILKVSSLNEEVQLSVYDCTQKETRSILPRIPFTHNYIIIIENKSHQNLEKLERLLYKKIKCYSTPSNQQFHYLFEGEELPERESTGGANTDETTTGNANTSEVNTGGEPTEISVSTTLSNVSTEEPIQEPKIQTTFLKTDTTLVPWLDCYIFKQLKAQYAPDFKRFEHNLTLNSEDLLKYLGTYFPRSYGETFCIFDNLFNNETVFRTYTRQKEFNILSVGCGTGGDILGLILSIAKFFPEVNLINIHAFDGNKEALEILGKIIEETKNRVHFNIHLDLSIVLFTDFETINPGGRFDFILTSKLINELITPEESSGPCYKNFLHHFLPLLTPKGLCLLLDVTTKSANGTFIPMLMNHQTHQYVSRCDDFEIIIPLPCQLHHQCANRCFHQKEFYISHTHKQKDNSRIAYYILSRKSYAAEIGQPIQDTNYFICRDQCCCFQVDEGTKLDAYYLPPKKGSQTKRLIKTNI